MSAFFVSDVHLSRMASPTGEALLSLVKRATKEATLFIILGDLFDLWVGSGSAFKKEYAPLIEEFKKLKKKCPIYYFEGNHDFQLKKFWEDELGFKIFPRPHEFEFGGLKIRAEHGDEINREDHGYLFLRWFLRTPPLRFLINIAPSKLVLAIGQRASLVSRDYTSKLPNSSLQIFRDYAQALRKEKDFDVLVTGHTHVADDFIFTESGNIARLINLGSWFDGPHYLKISPQGDIRNLKA
jgi:UDP-2,3-diacylglucosamine hydrolase